MGIRFLIQKENRKVTTKQIIENIGDKLVELSLDVLQ